MSGKLEYPAHIIAARGRKVDLIDGTSVVLVYSFSSIMRMEEAYGSIEGALAQLNSPKGVRLTAVVELMAAGLLHEGHPTNGMLSDVESLAPLLDSMLLKEYSDAIGEAFEASFPKPDPDESGKHADPTATEGSRGLSGSTPERSSSDEQTPSSGA